MSLRPITIRVAAAVIVALASLAFVSSAIAGINLPGGRAGTIIWQYQCHKETYWFYEPGTLKKVYYTVTVCENVAVGTYAS